MSTIRQSGRFSMVWLIVGVAIVPITVLGLLFLAEKIMRWHFYPGI